MAARSSRVYGLVVVTQTCDVVRQYEDREYVEVSPLVQIEPDLIREIQKGPRSVGSGSGLGNALVGYHDGDSCAPHSFDQ
jgi:hypothetical protein